MSFNCRRFIVSALLAVSALAASAQTRSVNLELLGASGMAGVNYDSRFKGNHGWGYSVGLGYGFVYSENMFGSVSRSHVVDIPFELNYLFGKKNSHLVLGAGIAPGASFDYVHDPATVFISEDGLETIREEINDHDVSWGFSPFLDIAYRLQKPSGFSFSAGFKPNLSSLFWPYLSFGYSF